MAKRAKYVLEGREAQFKGKHEEKISGPCIFCGKPLTHVNNGGDGWILGAMVNGKPAYFLYCVGYNCTPGMDNAIWRCGCEPDYIESVGDACHGCGCKEKDATPVPDP